MEQTKTSTRVLLVSAIVLLVILLTGPLGYKFSLVPLQPSLLSVVIAVAGGLLVALVALVFLVMAFRGGLGADRNMLLVTLVLSLIPAVLIVPQMAKARAVPPIHDISTDTTNPPVFVALKSVREESPNGLGYGSEAWPAEKLAEATLEAYPDLSPVTTDLSVAEAVQQSVATLEAMGLEIVDADETSGRVEATATTYWFGFKDDMVLRVVPDGSGSRIDVRSMSRVGQSDIGANAARIAEFASRF